MSRLAAFVLGFGLGGLVTGPLFEIVTTRLVGRSVLYPYDVDVAAVEDPDFKLPWLSSL